MESNKLQYSTTDEYIALFPPEIQKLLIEMRTTIKNAAPDAFEKISYQMPTFDLQGNLVHFAAFKNHIGFFPTSSGTEKFKEEIAVYKNSKGAVQFPLDKPLPLELVTKITKFRVQENLERAEEKKGKKKK
ncbi:MAG: DUF1801 domain-containing protein [Chloroflexota bacterium]